MKKVEWSYTWEELVEPPIININPSGLYIPLRGGKKVFGIFASGESGKMLAIQCREKCEVIKPSLQLLLLIIDPFCSR